MTTNSPTTPETVVAPAAGTPEYDAAMAAKFDASQVPEGTPPVAADERPEWLPEKFKSAADMAKAYTELEKKLGGPKAPEAPTTVAPIVAPAAAEATTAEAQAVVEQAGLNFDDLNTKFNANGALDATDYEALAKAGIPKVMVDSYVEAMTFKAQARVAEVYDTVGGQEKFNTISEWAATNLSEAEVTSFNKVIDAGDVNATKLAIKGLEARYVASNGAEPTLATTTNGAVSGEVYRSTSELTTAMKDPRYRKDAAYRADVQSKLGRSNIF